MPNHYVSNTAAGKSISAWIVLNKRGKYVATVRSHYSDGGTVLVNVFQSDEAAKRCGPKMPGETAYREYTFQEAKAGGGGYDKFAAALSGLKIDGHLMTDHCGARKTPPAGGVWPSESKAPKGWHFANYDRERNGYMDCYRTQGLKYLEEIGYRVYQAI